MGLVLIIMMMSCTNANNNNNIKRISLYIRSILLVVHGYILAVQADATRPIVNK